LKAEESKQGNVLGPLFTLCQLSEHEEALVSSALPHPDTLEAGGQAVQEAFGDTSTAHDGDGAEVLVGEIGEGEDDADGEDPFRDVEGDKLGGFDLRGPLVEGEKLVGGEDIDRIDGEGN
jgi:hypothetical protein